MVFPKQLTVLIFYVLDRDCEAFAGARDSVHNQCKVLSANERQRLVGLVAKLVILLRESPMTLVRVRKIFAIHLPTVEKLPSEMREKSRIPSHFAFANLPRPNLRPRKIRSNNENPPRSYNPVWPLGTARKRLLFHSNYIRKIPLRFSRLCSLQRFNGVTKSFSKISQSL